jgi:hypothetical protein
MDPFENDAEDFSRRESYTFIAQTNSQDEEEVALSNQKPYPTNRTRGNKQ